MAKKKANRNNVAQPSLPQNTQNLTPASIPTPVVSKESTKGNIDRVLFDMMVGSDREALQSFPQDQQDVFALLKSIYGEEVRLDAFRRTVWNKPLLGFTIVLTAYSDAATYSKIDFELPPEYPKIGPKVRPVDEEQQPMENWPQIVNEIVRKHIATELGDRDMITYMAQDIVDKLEDVYSDRKRKAEGTSLEEERASTEVAAIANANTRQQHALRQKEADAAAKEAQLAKDIETQRYRLQLLSSGHPDQDDQQGLEENYPADCVVFDRSIVCRDPTIDTDINFKAVRSNAVLFQKPGKKVSIACPYRNNTLIPIQLVLKEVRLPDEFQGQDNFRSTLQEIEEALQAVKKFDHGAIVKIYDYKLKQIQESDLLEHWELTVLTEFAQGGPLTNLLSLCGQMNAVRLRTYCRSILDALEYFDKQGYVHPAIHAHNILFFGSEHSRYQAKLSDGYGTTLRQVVEQSQNLVGHAATTSGNWAAPELIEGRSARSNKTCIWELGVVLLQMALGNDLTEKYTSPEDALMRTNFDMDFDSLISKMCTISARKRSNAFQIQSHQFFKSHEPSLIRTEARGAAQTMSLSRSYSVVESRWLSEWEPIGVLGKGGFGVVIKARNRLDGHFYAVKQLKCKSITDLEEIWSEVRMLAQLNHPGVVRYFGAWSEDEAQDVTDTETSTALTDPRSFAPPTGSAAPPSNLFSMQSTGHDFMAPSLRAGPDADEADEDEDSDDDDGNMFAYQPAPSDSGVEDSQAVASDHEDDSGPSDPFAMQQYIDDKIEEEPNFFESTDDRKHDEEDKIPSQPEAFIPAAGPPSVIRRPQQYYNRKSTLYIQMELCETGTLDNLIRNGLPKKINESWRIFRLLLDGLEHIHSIGVVHRDLKPMNIFIDNQKTPKIGDFGLASPSQAITDGHKLATHIAGPQSRGVGTHFYIPPELMTLKGPGRYSSKADMFALGVIFFEMCCPFKTTTERLRWLGAINEAGFELPEPFDEEEFKVQGRIIKSLLDHDPDKRPSAKDLLGDPEIPETLEEEKEQRWIQRLVHGDPQQFEHVMKNFLSKTATRAQLLAYSDIGHSDVEQPDQYLFNTIQDKLTEVFKAHGAVSTARETVFPVEERKDSEMVTFVGDAGFALQLPYNLTVPFARSIAVRMPTYNKSYCFGTIFRRRSVGVEPLCIPEADFDIISSSAKDLSLRDAQVISVLDDCLNKLGSLFVRSFSIVISHGDLLDLVLRACLVPEAQFEAVKYVLSSLNVGKTTWKEVQEHFKSHGLKSTTISALKQFDFSLNYQDMRRSVLESLTKLKKEDEAIKAVRTLNRLKEIDEYVDRLGVKCPVLYSPLSNNAEFLYRGSTMFKCLESRTKKMIAAGGRYDNLIRSYEIATQGTGARAVGFRLNIMDSARYAQIGAQPAGHKSAKLKNILPINMTSRVDVVITSFDEEVLKTHCIEIYRSVLDAGMSAELSEYYPTMDELDMAYANTPKYWLVIVRSLGTAQRAIKVRSPSREETDVPASDLINHLKEELGERVAASTAEPTLKRTRSSHGASDRENVVILTPQHKSKKVNRAAIVDSARTAAQEKVDNMNTNCKILAIDTDDETLHRMRNTRLADAESWRTLRHAVALTDREYVQEIQAQLQEWAKSGQDGAFICNYKTKTCVFYDFGKV